MAFAQMVFVALSITLLRTLHHVQVLLVGTSCLLFAEAERMCQFLVDLPLGLATAESQWRLAALLLGLADQETVWLTHPDALSQRLAQGGGDRPLLPGS